MKSYRYAVSAFVAMICLTALFARAPEWHLLGTKKVTFKTDRDVIHVGADEGVFKRVKLLVKKSGIHIMDMKIHFLNGDVMDVQVRQIIPAGGETRAIDLPGNNRIIQKVVFWYESTKSGKKRATVFLYGIK